VPVGPTKVNPKDRLTYVWISPGSFMISCSPGDKKCSKNENPALQVTITEGFWIGQVEVAQGAFEPER
jgi:formylglycine-generating enzyme required for sulfatase activity